MSPFVLLAVAVMVPDAGRDAVPLIGSVVESNGRPVAGALVLASLAASPNEAPRILGRTTSDDQGNFRLAVTGDGATTGSPTLWAYRAGSRVARRTVRDAGGAESIRLTLGAPGDATVAVMGPDGRPVPGARVVPRRLAAEPWAIPLAIGEATMATTDAEGLASFPAFFAEDLAEVEVLAKGFGSQRRPFRDADGKPSVDARQVTLRATGRVTGQLTADEPDVQVGRTIRVTTTIGDRGEFVVSEVETSTDPIGRFEIAEVVSGRVAIRVLPRVGSHDLPMRVSRRNLAPGRSVEVEIPIRRGVRVFGFVREAGGNQPVPGALLTLMPSSSYQPDPVQTDAEGRYETFVPPGAITHRIDRVPAPYLGPPSFVIPRPVEVPAGIAAFELPPIALARGGEIRGTVVDATGQPAAQARVEASWNYFDGRNRAPRVASTSSAADGSFVVGPVDPQADIRLVATSEAGSSLPVSARVASPDPIQIALVATASSTLTGRVVDGDGRPIAGASVRVWSVASSPEPSRELVEWLEASTDAEGRFQTPRLPLDRREYHAVAAAEGFLAGRSRVIQPDRPEHSSFADLTLVRATRKVLLEGRVVDRVGTPIEGVAVWTWGEGARCVRTTSDANGRYRLIDAAAGSGFLFASHPGFRFTGQAIVPEPQGGAVADLVLARDEEKPTATLTARPANPMHQALARTTIEPLVKKALGQSDRANRTRILEAFARLDPVRALTLLQEPSIQEPWLADHLRGCAARGLIATDPAQAVQVIAAIRDPEARMLVALHGCMSVDPTDLATRQGWLARAEVDAGTIRDPATRVVALAQIAGHWLDLKDEDHAKQLLREAGPLVERLPGVSRGARSRGEYAECLARIASADALTMIETLIDPIALDHHRIGVARVLAGRDPAEAGRLIASIRDPRSLAADLPALCHAMATSDPRMARSLLGRMGPGADPCLAPFSLGLMALAVAEADRPAALGWLREAYDLLDKAPVPVAIPAAEADALAHDPAVVAAGLLAVVERVDPALVPEFFWRSIAIRGPRPPGECSVDCALIPLLARFDQAAPLVLFEPLAARVRSGLHGDPCSWVSAAAAIDPDRALALIATMPEEPDASSRQPQGEARLTLASCLGGLASPNREEALADLLDLWSVGDSVKP